MVTQSNKKSLSPLINLQWRRATIHAWPSSFRHSFLYSCQINSAAVARHSLTFFECKLTIEWHCWVARQPGHFINLLVCFSCSLCQSIDLPTTIEPLNHWKHPLSRPLPLCIFKKKKHHYMTHLYSGSTWNFSQPWYHQKNDDTI